MSRVFILTEMDDGSFLMNENGPHGGVWPTIRKPNARTAIARLSQLLGIGPVAPQTEPEAVCIGSIETSAGGE